MTQSCDHDEDERGSQARVSTGSFEVFFKTYQPRLVRVLISLASDSSMAEDVVSETFMKAWDKWDKVFMYDRPDSWLYKVATRRLRRLEAQARARGSLAEDPASLQADLGRAAATDEWVVSNLHLVAALRLLPRRQAEVVAWRLLVDCTVKETAGILGVTEGTVKTQLNRALGKLQVLLDDPGTQGLVRRDPS